MLDRYHQMYSLYLCNFLLPHVSQGVGTQCFQSCLSINHCLFTKCVPVHGPSSSPQPPVQGPRSNRYCNGPLPPWTGAEHKFQPLEQSPGPIPQTLQSTDCQQAGGWHSTEMSSYYNCFCFKMLEPMEILLSKNLTIIW